METATSQQFLALHRELQVAEQEYGAIVREKIRCFTNATGRI